MKRYTKHNVDIAWIFYSFQSWNKPNFVPGMRFMVSSLELGVQLRCSKLLLSEGWFRMYKCLHTIFTVEPSKTILAPCSRTSCGYSAPGHLDRLKSQAVICDLLDQMSRRVFGVATKVRHHLGPNSKCT